MLATRTYFWMVYVMPTLLTTCLIAALGSPLLILLVGAPVLALTKVRCPLWAAWLMADLIVGAACWGLTYKLVRKELIRRDREVNPRGILFSWSVGCFLGSLFAWILFAPKIS